MKIGFDAKRFYNNRTGLGHYSRNLLKEYKATFPQDELALFTPKYNAQYEALAKGIGNTIVPSTAFKNYWRTLGIKKDLLEHQIQIYHGLSNEIPLGIEKTGIKSVVTLHDLLFLHFPDYYKAIDKFIYHKKFKSAATKVDKVIAISEATKSDLMQYFGITESKIEIIYPITSFKPATSLHTISRSKEASHDYLLCISSFDKRKNLERLIEAYNKVQPNYQLIIAGKSGDTAAACKKLIHKYKLKHKVTLHFDVSDEQIASLYREAMAFVYPSLYEGFGIPVVDALQYALPVLTSANSSMAEIAGPLGFYFDPKVIDSLAEQLWLLNQSAGYELDKTQLTTQLEKFSSKEQTQKLHQLYKQLI